MATLSEYAIVSIDEAREWLGDAADESILAEIINAVTDVIERYLGRKIVPQVVTEHFAGHGDYEHRLRYAPVIAINHITIDDLIDYSEDDCRDNDLVRLYPDEGYVWLMQTVWPKSCYPNCRIEYIAGYETTPLAIHTAALMLVKTLWHYRLRQQDSIQSVTVSGAGISESVSYLEGLLQGHAARELLEPFRRVVLA